MIIIVIFIITIIMFVLLVVLVVGIIIVSFLPSPPSLFINIIARYHDHGNDEYCHCCFLHFFFCYFYASSCCSCCSCSCCCCLLLLLRCCRRLLLLLADHSVGSRKFFEPRIGALRLWGFPASVVELPSFGKCEELPCASFESPTRRVPQSYDSLVPWKSIRYSREVYPEGPCIYIGSTLRPMYILYEYMDP